MRPTFLPIALSLLSLLGAVNAQYPTYINTPQPDAVLHAGQNLTLQLVRPYFHGTQPGTEISIVISIEHCNPTVGCNQESYVSEILYNGKYDYQSYPDFGEPYQNFTLQIRPDFALGSAQIKVARFIIDMGANAALRFNTLNVTIAASQTPSTYTIHPNGDAAKCVGLLGGTYANDTPVDIYDCNGSVSQKWQWVGNSLVSINPADNSKWCLDTGVALGNGVKTKIWQCYDNLPQQTWSPVITAGPIRLSVGGYCLDLTNGDKTNRNILQIWQCAEGNRNQIWTFTTV